MGAIVCPLIKVPDFASMQIDRDIACAGHVYAWLHAPAGVTCLNVCAQICRPARPCANVVIRATFACTQPRLDCHSPFSLATNFASDEILTKLRPMGHVYSDQYHDRQIQSATELHSSNKPHSKHAKRNCSFRASQNLRLSRNASAGTVCGSLGPGRPYVRTDSGHMYIRSSAISILLYYAPSQQPSLHFASGLSQLMATATEPGSRRGSVATVLT